MADPLSSSSSSRAAPGDLKWLALAVLGGAVLHFGWTVPRGPFEASSRNHHRNHASFVRLTKRFGSRSFDDEPKRGVFRADMQKAVDRGVGLARSAAIARGGRAWFVPSKRDCRSLRCRFDLCMPSAMVDQVEGDLRGVRIGGGRAWDLQRLSYAGGCVRFELRFLEQPGNQRLISLSKP